MRRIDLFCSIAGMLLLLSSYKTTFGREHLPSMSAVVCL